MKNTSGRCWCSLSAPQTDALDGLLARSLDQKSALGAYLDPIADKLLLSSSFIVLAMAKKIGWLGHDSA